MKRPDLITLDKLTGLFSTFVLGTVSIIISAFLQSFSFRLKQSIIFSFFIIAIMSYEFVILFLVNYYIIKGKEKLEDSYQKNKKGYLYSISIILLLTFSVSDAVHEHSWLVLIRDLAITILTVLFGPFIVDAVKGKLTKK